MPLPTKSDFENFTITDYGLPYAGYSIPVTKDMAVTDYGLPLVLNDFEEASYLWGTPRVRTSPRGVGDIALNSFGIGLHFVAAAGFLPMGSGAGMFGAAEVNTDVAGAASGTGNAHAVSMVAATALGAHSTGTVVTGTTASTSEAAGVTGASSGVTSSTSAVVTPAGSAFGSRDGAALASVITAVLAHAPAIVALHGTVATRVVAAGYIRRVIPVPTLGVRLIDLRAGTATVEQDVVAAELTDTRAGTVTVSYDTVGARLVDQRALTCAKVG